MKRPGAPPNHLDLFFSIGHNTTARIRLPGMVFFHNRRVKVNARIRSKTSSENDVWTISQRYLSTWRS